jgi:hypothetical protein
MKRTLTVFLLTAATALVFTAAAWALRFTDESYFPPVGTVGTPYSFTFGGAGGCGPALPYQFTIIGGSLPPGLSLARSGLVSGTPTNAGSYSFWVNLSDQNPPSADWCRPSESQREFTITINGPGGAPAPSPTPALSITTASLPTASVGTAYSTAFAASGGSGTKTWSVSAGSLPAGLALGANGTLSGTPTSPATSTFTVKVAAGGATAERAFSLDVASALQIAAPPDLQGFEVGMPLTAPLTASGGSAPYRWELTDGTLPTHVGFIGDQGDGSTGLIKGVPAEAGSFSLTFRVTDVRGRTTTQTITLRIADRLRIASVRMPRLGHVGKRYRAIGIAEGGIGVHIWSVGQGSLPAGLHLETRTGVITGKPSRTGRFVFYLTTKDGLGAVRSRRIAIVIGR